LKRTYSGRCTRNEDDFASKLSKHAFVFYDLESRRSSISWAFGVFMRVSISLVALFSAFSGHCESWSIQLEALCCVLWLMRKKRVT
jgi:hypothetical protein